ncbi:thiol-disulfide oxidoreductase DCC family protein [Bosea sp. 124]|uniref:thiol-disulfide oxidoreductase DCC family protein n=1 Tax=Bosea sp. 124 TaxID=2135642 RepID=UPI000D373B8E|nr:thiol-disulfide oxidoreductase DCC family protein [Bosea sp. 124]PTM38562.1 putative DCC family thiol-disulfide oxidoreductase YuxK [Bosea sp. 124]
MAGAPPVCLFDGVCVLCSGGVQYTLRHERDHEIRFVAIQSREGRALAQLHGVDPDQPDSFLFIENDVVLRKSEAVLGVVAHLSWPARLVLAARILPRSLPDWLYDRIARNRYRLFGRKESCSLPDPEQRHRFSLPETP